MKRWTIVMAFVIGAAAGCKRPSNAASPAAATPGPEAVVRRSYDDSHDVTYVKSPSISRKIDDRDVTVGLTYSFAGTVAAADPKSFRLSIASTPTGRGVGGGGADGDWPVPISVVADDAPIFIPKGEALTFARGGTRRYFCDLWPRDYAALVNAKSATVEVNDVAITLSEPELQLMRKLWP